MCHFRSEPFTQAFFYRSNINLRLFQSLFQCPIQRQSELNKLVIVRLSGACSAKEQVKLKYRFALFPCVSCFLKFRRALMYSVSGMRIVCKHKHVSEHKKNKKKSASEAK